MGNENKVTDIVQRSKDLFLPDELRPDEQQYVYSLNEEFAKSHKNRSYLFVLKVVGFLLIVVALAYFGAKFIEMVRDDRQVEITEFEDLRLRDIFDSSNKYQTELNSTRESLDNLRLQMQEDILSVKNGTSRDRESLLAKHLSPDETDTHMKKIREREDARINAIKSSYQRKLNAKENEIRSLNEKIAEANKDMKVNVQKAESIMGNYQKLHDIKMSRQRAAYERQISDLKNLHRRQIESLILKYNPVFRSAKIEQILKSGAVSAGGLPHLGKYSEVLVREHAFSKSDFERLRKNFESYSVLMDRMLQIPYENSVPPSLSRIDFLTRKLTDDYEKLWISLASIIIRKNRTIQNYRFAFDHHARLYPENGFIIDPREKDSVRVQLTKIHTVRSGDTGLVFRDDDEYIGKIEFVVSESDTTAKIIELAENKKLKPFDKILIKYRKEQP